MTRPLWTISIGCLLGGAPLPAVPGDHLGGPHPHHETPAQAQTPIIEQSAAPDIARDTIYYRYCAGVILRAVPEAAPGSYALALLRGDAWKEYGRAVYDAEGRMLRQEVAGRGTVSFDPHNCEKVAGICRYTETGLDGKVTSKLRINGLAGEEWNYSLVDAGEGGPETQTLTRVGTVTYAADGLAAEETWTSVTGTEDGCLKRLPPDKIPAPAQ